MKTPPLDSTDLTWLAGLARALLGEAHAAEDLVQETAVAALVSPLPPGAPKRAWLASVARRLAARRFRGNERRKTREEVAARPEALPDSAELVEKAEIAEQVTAAARRLPEPYRRTILLRFLEGMSPEEIARDEGKPVDTVRWRVRRGLELLREELVEKHDRDWSSWSVLLLPLARSRGDVGVATAGATGMSIGTVASLMTMKLKIAGAVAVGCLGLGLLWERAHPETQDTPAIDSTTSAEVALATPSAELTPSLEKLASAPERVAVHDAPAKEEPVETAPEDLLGTVVDEEDQPVAGAKVFLIQTAVSAPRKKASQRLRTQTKSDSRGEFRIAREDWLRESEDDVFALELGVTANGFLRRVVKEVLTYQGTEREVVVLQRGRTLSGRVIDESGRPVANLELLLCSANAGISHVSPSQRRLRSQRSQLAGSASTYDQCCARTDGRGEVLFTGLPEGDLQVLPLETGWTIEESRIVGENASYVEWVARQRLGVKLIVIDVRTNQPVEKAAATFAFEATFADGEVRDFEQWVGRGRGEVSFVLGPEILPGLEERTITRAVFNGTVRSDKGEAVEWKAEALEDPSGAVGVVEVRVELDSWAEPKTERAAGTDELEASATTTLEIDARYEDALPFEGGLDVRWISKSNPKRNDSARAEAVGLSRYRVEIPAGDWTLEISDRLASGSLRAWTDEVRCLPDRSKSVFATLPRGGAASILRPEGWKGEWFVHASWREPGDKEWRGSLGYSTDESRLTLRVLRPAEWKFELRRDSALERAPLVRTVLVKDGEFATVGE